MRPFFSANTDFTTILMKKRASEHFLRDADCHSHRCVSSVPEFNLANWNSLWNLTIFLKCFSVIIFWQKCQEMLYYLHKSGFGWEPTLPGDRLCKPGMGGASSRFPLGWELREASGQRILSAKASRICLSLLSVAQRKIFRKPHPSPASVTLWTAA